MTRKLVIFGNGLGMSLDSNFFKLEIAIKKIFEDKSLNIKEKNLIKKLCNNNNKNKIPEGEDDFDILHRATISCKDLSVICDKQKIKLLKKQGENLPATLHKFVFEVSKYFYNSQKVLEGKFLDPLCTFIEKTNSHIATLNYDNLLYKPFCKRKIVLNYDNALVDGIYAQKGFKSDNLKRKYDNKFGYYLHLHGSPIFYEDNEGKLKKDSTFFSQGEYGKHIVLTHIKHKTEVIASSYILHAYWRYLAHAINEVDEIILFGYSGFDDHLNALLKEYENKKIIVIEWKDPKKSDKERKEYWTNKLTKVEKVEKVIRLENILDFDNWENPKL